MSFFPSTPRLLPGLIMAAFWLTATALAGAALNDGLPAPYGQWDDERATAVIDRGNPGWDREPLRLAIGDEIRRAVATGKVKDLAAARDRRRRDIYYGADDVPVRRLEAVCLEINRLAQGGGTWEDSLEFFQNATDRIVAESRGHVGLCFSVAALWSDGWYLPPDLARAARALNAVNLQAVSTFPRAADAGTSGPPDPDWAARELVGVSRYFAGAAREKARLFSGGIFKAAQEQLARAPKGGKDVTVTSSADRPYEEPLKFPYQPDERITLSLKTSRAEQLERYRSVWTDPEVAAGRWEARLEAMVTAVTLGFVPPLTFGAKGIEDSPFAPARAAESLASAQDQLRARRFIGALSCQAENGSGPAATYLALLAEQRGPELFFEPQSREKLTGSGGLLRRAAELRDPGALTVWGEWKYIAAGVESDVPGAIRFWNFAAEKGNLRARALLDACIEKDMPGAALARSLRAKR